MRAFLLATELVSESLLPGRQPLALLPLIDRPLIQVQLEALVEHGITEITLLASAGVERFRALLGDGVRWGCNLTILPLSSVAPLAFLKELPQSDEPVVLAAAEQNFTPWPRLDSAFHTTGLCQAPASLLRELPEEMSLAQLDSYLQERLPKVPLESQKIGSLGALLQAQQVELECRLSGEVHIARSARVHPRARLVGPVWIGPQCRIGAGVVLGPNVCLGAGCIIERGTRLQDALIAPGSYIGAELELNQVYVDRSRLISLRQDVGLTVEDGFLLGTTSPRRLSLRPC